MKKIDYNKYSAEFNKRYEASPMNGVFAYLNKEIAESNGKYILDAGCGAGYFLNKLSRKNQGANFYGVDISIDMLRNSPDMPKNTQIIQADFERLPFKNGTMDFIYFLNSIHLANNISLVLKIANYLLREEGLLCIIMADVFNENYNWYIHDFFRGAVEWDRNRIPGKESLLNKLHYSGFKNIIINEVERSITEYIGLEVLSDPFLVKNATSTLLSISNEEYESGIEKIKKLLKDEPEHKFRNEIIYLGIICSRE